LVKGKGLLKDKFKVSIQVEYINILKVKGDNRQKYERRDEDIEEPVV
jgi:hypothetical protein